MKKLNCRLCGREVNVSERAITAVCSVCVLRGDYSRDRTQKITQSASNVVVEEKPRQEKKESRSKRIDDLYKQGLSKEQILQVLKQEFPQATEASLKAHLSARLSWLRKKQV